MAYTEYQDIGLVTSPIAIANKNQLSNLVNIFSAISKNIYFITGNAGSDILEKDTKIHTYPIKYKIKNNLLLKVIAHVAMQLKISYKFIQINKKSKIWIFFHGSGTLLFPILIATFLGKRVVLMLPGSSKALKYAKDPFYIVVKTLEFINLALADKIIIYSNILIEEWGLEKYRYKVSIAHEHFLDFSNFSITYKYRERQSLVGYVGRLSEEKGILNLIKAIPEVIKWNPNIRFLIIGEGKLHNEIESYLIENDMLNYVVFSGWVPHDELPKYFNQMKLMVLPSYSEGLPNVILEAMACGTPVLTTSVGSVPDIVTNKVTGFILENNSPRCIAESIINIFGYPRIDQVIKNACCFVKKQFSFEYTVERFTEIIQNIDSAEKNTFLAVCQKFCKI